MAGLQELVTLVTGGASGIGRATAERFIKGGAKVVIFDLPTSKGEQVASDLGEKCTFVPGDVRVLKDVERSIKAIGEDHGKLDVLVNCAGIIKSLGDNTDTDLETAVANVKSDVEVNAVGTLTVIRAATKLMQGNVPGADGERGVIVNIGSVAAFKVLQGVTAYAGTKGYINSITLALAKELAEHGIRVNCVNPGAVNTPLVPRLTKEGAALREHVPSTLVFPKRYGEPDEVAFLIQHIVENKYINGATITIDAGMAL